MAKQCPKVYILGHIIQFFTIKTAQKPPQSLNSMVDDALSVCHPYYMQTYYIEYCAMNTSIVAGYLRAFFAVASKIEVNATNKLVLTFSRNNFIKCLS